MGRKKKEKKFIFLKFFYLDIKSRGMKWNGVKRGELVFFNSSFFTQNISQQIDGNRRKRKTSEMLIDLKYLNTLILLKFFFFNL